MSQKLALVWMAQFRDGTILYQYTDEEQTKEHLFREVLDKQDTLKLFSLINVRTNRVYRVDLEYGRFHFFAPGFVAVPEDVVDSVSANPCRLIHFRRVQKNFCLENKIQELSTSIKYFLVYQYNTPDGKNVKHIAQITENDEVYLI